MSQLIQVTLMVTAAQLAQIIPILDETAEAPAEPAPRPRTRAKAAEPESKAQPEVKGKDAAGDEVDEVPDQAAVTKAAQAYAKANGRDALVEMLGRYDATQVSGVPEEQRAAFIEACNA